MKGGQSKKAMSTTPAQIYEQERVNITIVLGHIYVPDGKAPKLRTVAVRIRLTTL
jgi:hypothetical protein